MALVFPVEVYPPTAVVQGLNGTIDQNTGRRYLATGLGRTSSPSLQVQRDSDNSLTNLLVKLANDMRVVRETNPGLQFGVFPGGFRQGGTNHIFDGAVGQFFTDDATNSVFITSANVLTISTTGFPVDLTTFMPLASVVCASGDVVSNTDLRSFAIYSIPQTTSESSTGTLNQTFIVDEGNVGAQRDSAFAFNRGSTGEDAAIRWDAGESLFKLFIDITVETLAALDIASLNIAGVLALDANGAAKVASAVAGLGLLETAGVLKIDTATSAGTGISGNILTVQTGPGIQLGSNGVEARLKPNSGLRIISNELDAKVDDSTIEADSVNGLQIKDGGITEVKLSSGIIETATFVLTAQISNGNTVDIFNNDADIKFRVIDAWAINESANSGSWQVDDGSTIIVSNVSVGPNTDKDITRAEEIDDVTAQINIGDSLRVVGDGSSLNATIIVQGLRLL